MAVPKRRMSRSRTHKRRANHDKLTPTPVSSCANCGSPVRSHHVCLECGTYRGREIVEPRSVEEQLDTES
ncbi:MAG: 50S ribosomal protein L32 [Myxococcales bacterium]|nr:50S ribosomal protein L32 [Myxococcales bacterium]